MPRATMRQLLDEAAAGKAMTAAIRELFREHLGNWDPRGPGKASRAAMKELCAQRMHELGMAGHAGDYEPLSVEDMKAPYADDVRAAA
jgi:fructose-bisphosphate aldolase class II